MRSLKFDFEVRRHIVEITHDKRGVMQGFTTNSDISNTKAKPECF